MRDARWEGEVKLSGGSFTADLVSKWWGNGQPKKRKTGQKGRRKGIGTMLQIGGF